MALIPRANDSVILTPSSPVPIRGSSVAGVAESAQANLGGDISKLGVAIMQHQQKQEDMAQSNSFQISSAKVQATYQESFAEAQRTASPDGSDIVQKMNDIAGPKLDDIKSNGPSAPEYADRLDAVAQATSAMMSAHAKVAGLSMLEKYNADGADKVSDTYADSVRQNPNPQMVATNTKAFGSYLDERVTKGNFTPQERTKLMNTFNEKQGLSYIDGLSNSGKYGQALNYLTANQQNPDLKTSVDPEQARQLGLIDSKEADMLKSQGKTYDMPALTTKDGAQLTPELTAAMSAIDPLKKAAMIDHLQGKVEAQGNLKLGELNSNITSFEYLAYHGAPISEAQVADLKNQVNMNPALTPFARVRNMDAINTAVASQNTIKLLQTAPRSKWDSIINSFDSRVNLAHQKATGNDPQMAGAGADLSVQANRAQAKERVQSYADKLTKIQAEDAGQFSIDSDQTMNHLYRGTKDNDPGASQKFARQSLSRQDYLQIPKDDQSILPNADAQSMGAALKNMPNSEAADDFIKNIQTKWGPYAPKVLAEVAQTDKSLEKYQALAYIPAGNRFGLVDAIKNQDVIKKSFTQIDQKSVVQKDINTQVNSALGQFSQAVSGGSNDSSRIGIVNTYRDAMELQVKKEFVKDPSISVADASKKAYDDVIGSQFNVVQGQRSAVIVPKTLAGQPMLPSTVSDYMSRYSDAAGFKELDPFIPKDPMGKYAANPDSFYSDLAARSKWVTNQSQDGIKLMNTEMDGTLTPIYDKFGKPIEKKYTDLSLNPVKRKEKASLTDYRGGG